MIFYEVTDKNKFALFVHHCVLIVTVGVKVRL